MLPYKSDFWLMAHQGLRWEMAWDVGFCLCDLAVFLLVHLSSFRFNRYIVLFFLALFCRHKQNFHLGERNRAAMSRSHRAFGVSPCSTLWIFLVRGFYGFCTIFTWSNLMLCSQIPFFGFFSIFIPSVVNYIIPGVIMYFAIPKEIKKELEDYQKIY